MYFSRRRLCLFIVILAEVGNVLGQTIAETTSIEQENNEVCADGESNDEITKNSIDASNSLSANTTTSNTTTVNNTMINCLMDKVYGPVEIVNATRLAKLLRTKSGPSNRSRNNKEARRIPGSCILVLFYARWCIFSSQAAPHFNALPRSFPHIKAVAIDAAAYQNFNAQYGIIGVPTLMLVHDGKAVAKFNGTVYNLESFARFITQLTNLQPNGSLYVTSLDFSGPVSSVPTHEMDYCLLLSWVFIAACALYFTLQSRWWQQFVELVQNTWRESNAQHEHAD